MSRPRILLTLLSLVAAVLVPLPAAAQAPAALLLSTSADGPPATSVPGIATEVGSLRAALGADNGTASATTVGYREVTWDEAADADAAPAHLPADYFSTVVPKGLLLDGGDPSLTGARGFMVSATEPTVELDDTEFGNLNTSYRTAFTPFDPSAQGRMFAVLGSTALQMRFTVPGTEDPATVRGFGVVMADVDLGSASKVELYDADDDLLLSIPVPAATGDEGLSFVGASFADPLIATVRMTLGTDAVEDQGAPNDGGQNGPGDVVVLDNVIFGEPQPQAQPDEAAAPLQLWEATTSERAAADMASVTRGIIGPEKSAFLSQIGGADNQQLVGTQLTGYRQVTFDDLDAEEAHPSTFPGGYHQDVERRGLTIRAPGETNRSALSLVDPAELLSPFDAPASTPTPTATPTPTTTPTATPAAFASAEGAGDDPAEPQPAPGEEPLAGIPSFRLATATTGTTVDPPDAGMSSLAPDGRVLVALDSNTLELTWTLPGTATPAGVGEVGFVLSDVDEADTTTITLYDIEGNTIHTHPVAAAPGDHSMSFVGMRFARPLVHRAVLVLGSAPAGALDATDITQGGAADIVALDQVVYGEPFVQVDHAFIGLEDNGSVLHQFNALDARNSTELPITGLDAGETLVALERDQTTGTVYGLGSKSNLYCLGDTGAALPVRPLNVELEGTSFGFDYNPATRRLITVSNAGQHLSSNRFIGDTVEEDPFAYAGGDGAFGETPSLSALALDGEGSGWALDGQNLVRVSGSTLTTIGQLAAPVATLVGLERTEDGTLWTTSNASGSSLVSIDATTAGVQRVGDLKEPMIGLIDDGEFGPCPPSPLALTSEGDTDGPKILVDLSLVNDDAAEAVQVVVGGEIPDDFELVKIEVPEADALGLEREEPCAYDGTRIDCVLGDLPGLAEVQIRLTLALADDGDGDGPPPPADGDDAAALELDLTASASTDGEVADRTRLQMEIPPRGFELPHGPFGEDDVVRTAVSISSLRFDAAGDGGRSPDHVVISRLDAFADSLAGSALTRNAPLLFAGTDAVPQDTLDEVDRVLGGAGVVYLLGGEVALSPAVADALSAAGYEVRRLAGESRVETAVAVAQELVRLQADGDGTTRVLVARATSPADNPTAAWADSVTAGGHAASAGAPVLVTPTGSLHPAVAAFLAANPDVEVILLGGEAALSPDVAGAIPGARRVAGPNRAATAVAIADELWPPPAEGQRRHIIINVGVEGGWAFGLAAAGLAADAGAPLLTVVGGRVPDETVAAIDTCIDEPVGLMVLGGAQVSEQQAQELDRLDTGICG